MRRTFTMAAMALMLVSAGGNGTVEAQGLAGRIKNRVKQNTKRKAEDTGVKAVSAAIDGATGAVVCAVADTACQDKAKTDGRKVVIDSTSTGTAADVAAPGPAPAASKPRQVAPGSGAWANYDFRPGERILFADDFTKDAVGDFPRRLEFVSGNMEIVEWEGGRWLRAGGRGDFNVVLPETLPERFTLEFDLFGYGNGMEVHFADPQTHEGQNLNFLVGHGGVHGHGITAMGESGYNTAKAPVAVRVMADGRYVKVYVNETRVANVPTANLGRADRIWFTMNGWSKDSPRMVANLRVAAGGTSMYDAIAAEGRVATQGIYFTTGSDVIRPESTPTLKAIAAMLTEHADLQLMIEGHTDNTGSASVNQTLSEQRAAAVKAALVEHFSVEAARLATAGFGASKPAAGNDTPEGRQSNRRVELVRR